jgi:hypothetical protein
MRARTSASNSLTPPPQSKPERLLLARSFPIKFDLDPGRPLAPFALSAFLAASFRLDTAGPVDEPKPEATGAPIDCGAFSLAHFKSVLKVRCPRLGSGRYHIPLSDRPFVPLQSAPWPST